MQDYQPGTHIIATLEVNDMGTLISYENCRTLLNGLIEKFTLQNLGDVYHNFSPQGFTALVCLSESHISIHTWPEFSKVNLDIYLSNFQRNNDGTVQHIMDGLVHYFNATIAHLQIIKR